MSTANPVQVQDRSSESARRDWFEWLLLAAFAGLGFAVLAGLYLRTGIKGGYVTGSDGYLVVDALQYLNWLRQSGVHLAAANLYDFAELKYTFVHPGLIAAGLLHRLGVGLVLSYALVKPFAICSIFFGAAALVHRHLDDRGDRRAALATALFYCAPAAAVAGWLLAPSSEAKFQLDFAGGEVWNGSYLWGYSFTAIAVGLVPLGLVAWERGRAGGQPKLTFAAAGCGLIAAWFQPWQGATFAGIVVATELLRLRADSLTIGRAARNAAPVAVAVVLPLVYYFVLSKLDPAWTLAGTANNERPRWPLWVLIATLGPLAIPAALAYRRGAWDSAGSVALRVWPVVGLAIYFAPVGTFPFHAIQGMQLPLAVLAVVGVSGRMRDRGWSLPTLLAVVAVAVLCVPGTVYRVGQMKDAVNAGQQAFFLTDAEHSALNWLDSNTQSGGVITENYLGTVIPAWTGRQTWIGAGSWTPMFEHRRKLVDALFAGRLSASDARLLLQRPGAGFILEDCRAKPGFFAAVSGLTTEVWADGCVKILRVNDVPGGLLPSAKQPALPAIPTGAGSG